MFNYESSWSAAAVRRFLVRVKPEYLEDLFDLRLADMYGMYNEPVDVRYSAAVALLLELKERIAVETEKHNALSLKDMAVNGKDLMAIGIPAGKQLGIILNELMECVLEDPQLNNKEALIKIAESLKKEKLGI